MTIIIQFKSPERTLVRSSFELEPEEFRRLISDFDKYKKDGAPARGTYSYLIKDRDRCVPKELALNFNYVLKISSKLMGL
jgi:hypothetical protein